MIDSLISLPTRRCMMAKARYIEKKIFVCRRQLAKKMLTSLQTIQHFQFPHCPGRISPLIMHKYLLIEITSSTSFFLLLTCMICMREKWKMMKYYIFICCVTVSDLLIALLKSAFTKGEWKIFMGWTYEGKKSKKVKKNKKKISFSKGPFIQWAIGRFSWWANRLQHMHKCENLAWKLWIVI